MKTWDDFLNALQLSIDTPIANIKTRPSLLGNKKYTITFEKNPRQDIRWIFFEKLIPGSFENNTYSFNFTDGETLEDLTDFLMLTRLQEPLIKKIVELDNRFKPYGQKLGLNLTFDKSNITDIRLASEIIFSEMAKKNKTIRELAHLTQLSMVSISNFKAGKDIRLSNFLKIAKALGLIIKIK
ncbi:MAG TPA: hypothetical protein DDW49_06690 [Deltaproteobacteria bacterium]|nr:MAG: hypothetical protein A2048_04765 [Deltaproteobacteria bacterium GWA2_45_12]HBF13058.1 hypothetical protein [Deltaproteobacteria bacterium]